MIRSFIGVIEIRNRNTSPAVHIACGALRFAFVLRLAASWSGNEMLSCRAAVTESAWRFHRLCSSCVPRNLHSESIGRFDKIHIRPILMWPPSFLPPDSSFCYTSLLMAYLCHWPSGHHSSTFIKYQLSTLSTKSTNNKLIWNCSQVPRTY